jgi:MFS family permease
MLIPELPAYLSSLGGGEYKGLIVALFTLTALLSRPFSGALADKVGRVPVMMFGSSVCFVCSLIYPVVGGVAGFLLLRLIHGFSTGFTPTGQTAYVSDIVPVERRGEAMGLIGMAGSLGMMSGPAIGGNIASYFSLDVMFYCSSALGLISILILMGLRETLQERQRLHPSVLKIHWADWFEPRVLMPCVVMVLCMYAYGTLLTMMPDLGASVGMKNKGMLFTYLTAASVIVRLLGGKASDRWGRKPVLLVSTLFIAAATLVLAFADTRGTVICGVMLYGLGHGATSPTLLAWATDLSPAYHKGRGLASLYMFMELGIGIGAFASGWIYGNDNRNFLITFCICSILAAIAFLYLTLRRKPVKLAS